jgi:zinc finger SWIM domain-containing protein 3
VNLFWSDGQSQIDYGAFGDVIVSDSTYRVNRYNLPFIPFIGVNHHRSTIVFGCGILSDETMVSYVWLLKAFLQAMHQKNPKSLITDGDAAMAGAIDIVMSDANHRLCSWHIEQNALKRFRGPKLKDFRKLIYSAMEQSEFESLWTEFRDTHNIKEDNLWMNRMYELRHKWAATFTRGRRFLGMQSN